MADPLITIGLTCYNAADTIERAIRSAVQQTYSNFEIIIVDDASTDNSVQVIEALIAQNPKIKLILHPENRGYPAALNTLIGAAQGEYIAFFDDDDVSREDRLTIQVRRLSNFERLYDTHKVLCYTNRQVVREGQTKIDHVAPAIGRLSPEPHGTAVADYLLYDVGVDPYVWGVFGSGTMMVRTKTLRELGGFDVEFRRCAEWDLAIRAAFQDAWFIAVNDGVVTQFKTNTPDKSGRKPLDYALKLREKHKTYLDRQGIYQAARTMAQARFQFFRGQIGMSRMCKLQACLQKPNPILRHQIKLSCAKAFGSSKHAADTFKRWLYLSRYMNMGLLGAFIYLAYGKLDGKVVATATFKGRFFSFRKCDVLAIREVLDEQEYGFLQSYLRKRANPVVLDMGAHIGLPVLWFKTVNPAVKVVSVEASPSTYKILQANVTMNPDIDWQAYNRAAWGNNDTLQFSDEGEGMSRHVQAGGKVGVQGITLAELVATHAQNGRVDLLKVDIEGAEEQFILAGRDALRQIDAVVIELHPKSCDTDKVRAVLAAEFDLIDQVQGRQSSKPVLFCRRSVP